MPEPLRSAVAEALCDELQAALGRIQHCLAQLRDEDVWSRPRPDRNAIGNLLLHLTGNVRQLILSVVGGEPDHRDRPAEFAARETLSKHELQEQLTSTVDQAQTVIRNVSSEELCRRRPVRDSEWTGVQSLVRSVAHFRGHTQEIIHMTRTILGENYRYAGPR